MADIEQPIIDTAAGPANRYRALTEIEDTEQSDQTEPTDEATEQDEPESAAADEPISEADTAA